MEKQLIGRLGEEAVSRYLTMNSYNIIERNFRTLKGELDIIAIKDDLIIVVEVKTRSDDSYILASQAVNSRKIKSIKTATRQYVKINKLYDYNIRFDVVECYWKLREIRHIKNAF